MADSSVAQGSDADAQGAFHTLAVDTTLARLESSRQGLPSAESAKAAETLRPQRAGSNAAATALEGVCRPISLGSDRIADCRGARFPARWANGSTRRPSSPSYCSTGCWAFCRKTKPDALWTRCKSCRRRWPAPCATGARVRAGPCRVPGDVIRVEAGDYVPADARLLNAAQAGRARGLAHRRVRARSTRTPTPCSSRKPRLAIARTCSTWARRFPRARPTPSSLPPACKPS